MIKAIIFDFDGVICESVGVKKEAFARVFQDYPEHVDEIVDYHMLNGGLSRYKKFDYIFANILKEELTEEKSKELGQQFTDYGYQGVLQSAYVPGALEFLKEHHQQLLLFVASGTPQDEMRKIVEDKDLGVYFKGVYGSPDSKGDIARKILSGHELEPKDVLFVGDAINDLIGAKETNIPFIGRVHESYENPFTDLNADQLIGDLFELKDKLKSVNAL